MRARKEGFLSPPVGEGREGGVATDKAKDVIVSTPVRCRPRGRARPARRTAVMRMGRRPETLEGHSLRSLRRSISYYHRGDPRARGLAAIEGVELRWYAPPEGAACG